MQSVNEVFGEWEGVIKSRERLVEQLQSSIDFETTMGASAAPVPDKRLLALLHQGVAYQMEFSRYHPGTVPSTRNLLRDFECPVLPNAVHSTKH